MPLSESMWAWAPTALAQLGGFVFVVLVPLLCYSVGTVLIRRSAS